jgi:hypothetical protein
MLAFSTAFALPFTVFAFAPSLLKDLPKSDQLKIFKFAQKYPVKLKEITKIFRIVREEKRQAIIVRVHLQALKKLIFDLNKHFNYHFTYPPTHITLFTLKGMEGGIGVNSQKDYRQLTQKINKKYSLVLENSFKLI